MSQNVQIKGGQGPNAEVAVVDEASAALVGIDYIHHQIHDGCFFEVDAANATVADNGTVITAITTPADMNSHLRWRLATGGDAQVEFLEGSTITGGTTKTANNRNRASTNVPASVFTLDPTVTIDGTTLSGPVFLPGGTIIVSGGATQDSFIEWVLQPSTTYVLRITNISGASQPISVAFDWYEVN